MICYFSKTAHRRIHTLPLNSLPADEPDGSIVDWDFKSGTSGELAFDFWLKEILKTNICA